MPQLKRLAPSLGCLLCIASWAAEPSPVKLAPSSRFELSGIDEVSALTEADILQGHAVLTRPHDAGSPDSLRDYAVEFPVFHFTTNEISIQFIPTRSGQVQLRLNGFRDSAGGNLLFKEEILWHGIKVEGALVVDDDASRQPRPIRTCYEQPTDLLLKVTGDTPVLLRLSAQAVRPSQLDEMHPISSATTPAHQAAKRFAHGVVLSRSFELAPGAADRVDYSDADFARIKAEGFDHVRVPVAWHRYLDKGNRLSPNILRETDRLVMAAEKQGLGVILALHGFSELASNPAGGGVRIASLWEQISSHYSKAPASLAFELLDEPGSEIPTKTLMSLYADLIPMVRRSSSGRTLFVSPSGNGTFSHLARVRLPDEDDNVIVSLDCSDPAQFTQQGRSGSKLRGVLFPGPPETPLSAADSSKLNKEESRWLVRYNQRVGDRNPSSPGAFKELVALVAQWSAHYGRPVYFGQMGTYYKVDPLSRARYCYAFRTTLERRSMGWAMRGWRGDDFRYWDSTENQPLFGLQEALFATKVPDWVHQKLKFGAATVAVSPISVRPKPPGTTASEPNVGGGLALAQVEAAVSRQLRQTVTLAAIVLSVVILLATVWVVRSQRRVTLPASLPLGADTPREGLIRNFARMMANTAVPRLMTQKRELLEIQQRAALELAELEKRLEAVHAPLQHRLEAYEQRIADLEKELARKGQENQELLKIKIRLAKEHLQSIQSRGKLELN